MASNFDFAYDAPMYVDFQELNEYMQSDSWFDDHTEAAELRNEIEQHEKTDATHGGKMETEEKKTSKSEPGRVLVEMKHGQDGKTKCPSPTKKQRLSSDSPSANTRSKCAQLTEEDLSLNVQQEHAREMDEARGGPMVDTNNPPETISKSSQRTHRPATSKTTSGNKVNPSSTQKGKSGSGMTKWNSLNTLSTEERELEKIEDMKKELARARKLAQDSYKKAISGKGYVPVRSANPTTMPQEFKFKTDTRIKGTTPQNESRFKDFAQSLRVGLPKAHTKILPSKPKPFKLSSAKSTGALLAKPKEKFKSVAESVKAFGDRLRPQPRDCRTRSAAKCGPPKSPMLTQPKTPNLSAKTRSRPVHALTREEKEELEFEEHQRLQFKACPVNRRVLEGGSTGVPKIEPKPLTVVREFRLHGKSTSLRNLSDHEEEIQEFKAKPVNPSLFKGPLGVKPKEVVPITVPQSPAFCLRSKMRTKVSQEEAKPQSTTKFAHLVPNLSKPFRPKLEHQHTVPEPFVVEERSKQMLHAREQKVQQYFEEERKAREFHAQLLPSDSPDQLPEKQPRPLTQPEPFELTVDQRGQKYQEQFHSKQVEAEQQAAREASNFKATASEVVNSVPFKPVKASKPLTEFTEFALNTDIRACRREVFDQHLKEREAQIDALKREREERKEMEEKSAVARMRRECVHKAYGIKKYKGVEVQPSDKPLTEAKTPRFVSRHRSRMNSD